LTRETTPEKIEEALAQLVARDQWAMLSHWLIWHGRRRCDARRPACGECEIQRWCPKVGV
jgi:endonuclease-3